MAAVSHLKMMFKNFKFILCGEKCDKKAFYSGQQRPFLNFIYIYLKYASEMDRNGIDSYFRLVINTHLVKKKKKIRNIYKSS